MKHPYAEILYAIADGKPIQVQGSGGKWIGICNPLDYVKQPAYSPSDLRVKPETITINGIEVPYPVDKPLEKGTYYYVVNMQDSDCFTEYRWDDDGVDSSSLERGIIHLTEEAAVAHAKALLSFTSK